MKGNMETQIQAQPQNQTSDLKGILESLLFVARKPLPPAELEKQIGFPKDMIKAVLEELIKEYEGRGINIVKVAGGYLMGTNPENADHIHSHLHAKVETTLTHKSLEVLAIIAYQQPITRPQIDSVRGVNSDSVLRTLTRHALIEEVGRSEGPGRPFLYSTTTDFLSYFGLNSMQELPPLQLDPELEFPPEPLVEGQQDPDSLNE